MTVVRECKIHQGGVKGIRKVCQFTERCDGYEGGVRRCGKAYHLTEGVTVIREV